MMARCSRQPRSADDEIAGLVSDFTHETQADMQHHPHM
jgi:hypothetical protein